MDPRRAGNYSIFKRKLKNPFIQSGLYSLDIYDFMVLVFIFGFGYTSLNVSRHSEAHVVLDDSKLKKIGSTLVFLKVSNVKQSEVSDLRCCQCVKTGYMCSLDISRVVLGRCTYIFVRCFILVFCQMLFTQFFRRFTCEAFRDSLFLEREFHMSHFHFMILGPW